MTYEVHAKLDRIGADKLISRHRTLAAAKRVKLPYGYDSYFVRDDGATVDGWKIEIVQAGGAPKSHTPNAAASLEWFNYATRGRGQHCLTDRSRLVRGVPQVLAEVEKTKPAQGQYGRDAPATYTVRVSGVPVGTAPSLAQAKILALEHVAGVGRK